MSSSLNVSLTNELRRYVDSRASDSDVFSTPSEYIRDLIRRDMRDWAVVASIAKGLREAREGQFAEESILDILNES
jgi:antitoxin ParD1/3/4